MVDVLVVVQCRCSNRRRTQSRCPAVRRQGGWRFRDDAETRGAEQQSRCLSFSFSSATEAWIPVVQQRTDATPLRSCSSSSRSSTSLSWQRQIPVRELRRRSRLHRTSPLLCRFKGVRHGKDGRVPTVAADEIPESRRSVSRDWRAHLSATFEAPGRRLTNTAMLKTMLLHSHGDRRPRGRA